MTEVYIQILLGMEVLRKTKDVHTNFQENQWMPGNSIQILKSLNESRLSREASNMHALFLYHSVAICF